MVSITSFITTVASIAAIASAFKLEVAFFRPKPNFLVGINEENKLVIGENVEAVDFSYDNGILFVKGTKKIVFHSNIDGLATAVEPDQRKPWDQNHGYVIWGNRLVFIYKPAKAEKLNDGTYAIHFEHELEITKDYERISIHLIE